MAVKRSTHKPDLAKRVQGVLGWATKRGYKQPIAFLVNVDPTLQVHDARMRYVRTHADPNIKASDKVWIEKCEKAIKILEWNRR